MRPLLISTTDVRGGAARAAYRLHLGLRAIGVESRMLVQSKYGTDPDVIGPSSGLGRFSARLRPRLDALALHRYELPPGAAFSSARVPERVARRVRELAPDLVHLHWIADAFLRIETIRSVEAPVVWTLHDMWAFTGGCHYDAGCGRYGGACGRCPILGSVDAEDVSRRVWKRKQRAWADLDFTVVTPSRWLAECARNSTLFQNRRIEVIPYGLDLSVFRPVSRERARAHLGLPVDRKIVLFGAASGVEDPRKGFDFLRGALSSLLSTRGVDDMMLLIFGGEGSDAGGEYGVECRYTGSIADDTILHLIYSAADVFVAPSRQDNLPNTVQEATACGTPCVAFRIGGMPDLIAHRETGYLAEPFAVEDLAAGVRWVLDQPDGGGMLRESSRHKAEHEYDHALAARRYLALYEEVSKSPSVSNAAASEH